MNSPSVAPIFAVVAVCLFAIGCGPNDDAVVHTIEGPVNYYPFDEGDQIDTGMAPECTSEASIATEDQLQPGDYLIRLDCEGWFNFFFFIPSDQAEIDAIPAGQETPYSGLSATWDIPGLPQGNEISDANWSQEWLDNCEFETNPTMSVVRREPLQGQPKNEDRGAFRGAFRFDFAGCVRGELSATINVE